MGICYSTSLRLAALATLTASVYACSSDSATIPDATPSATLTTVLREASLPALEAIGATLAAGPAPVGSFVSVSPAPCPYDSSLVSFVCPQLTSAELTIDRSYTLYDGAGNRQAQFGTSTEAVQTKTHIAGTSTFRSGPISTDYADDRTVSGLRTTRHVLNGTSISTMDATFAGDQGLAEASSSTSVAKIEGLVLPSASNRWPGPGTLTVDNTASFGGLAPMSSHLQAVFSGTRCVVISFTSAGIAQTMTIDLSVGDATAACTP
jgi:hypothetical protein